MAKVSKLSEDEARKKSGRLADITAILRKKKAKEDQELNEIKQKYANDTAALTNEAKTLSSELISFMKKNTHLFVKNRKSWTWGPVTFSNAINPPALSIAKTITWDEAAERLESEGFDEFIRVQKDINKDLIKARILDTETGEDLILKLAKLGIVVTQTEKWEVKVAETPNSIVS